MKIIAAYTSVVLIWATTPLAIKWSNSTLSYMEAVTARMSFSVVGALFIAAVLDRRVFQSRKDWLPMLIGALKLYPIMLIVYWSAQYIPSGLISVIFGATPFFVGLFSIALLGENNFNPVRIAALIVACFGLVVIHFDQLNMNATAALGVLGILVSTILFALCTVALKKSGASVDPVRQLAGSLVIAAPCFLITWVFTDGELPTYIDSKSISAVLYLVVAGSIVGGLAFYYVLKKCDVQTVSLIPLMTPVAALIIGYVVDGEKLDATMFVGIACVLGSLALYLGVLQIVYSQLRKARCFIVARVQRAFSIS